ncbi:hypothetical protein L7D48_06435 [Streptomyces sp. S1A]|uniref:hypothetical protein n=1 Tax=Streptomyces sp. ICN903 TaxID=2964654 RepID=UPI001EDC87CA|nr:hypothetical protein [Streptomyces sp. ICN903]MCG3040207.1 hypothetical protein [Streptomyces sp. ICN903]
MGIMDRVRGMAGRHGGKAGETSGSGTRGRHRRRTGTRDAKIREARERLTRERDEKGNTAGPAA